MNIFFNMDTGLQSLPIDKSSIDPIVADKDGNRHERIQARRNQGQNLPREEIYEFRQKEKNK